MPRSRNAIHRHFDWDESSQCSSCKLCGRKLKGNHATNLMNHMRLKHECEFKEVVEINKTLEKTREKRSVKDDEKEKKRKKLIDCCIKLIAIHGRPFEYLEDEAFRDIKSLIDTDFVNEASSKKIKELLADKAYGIREKITSQLKRKIISIKLDSATCLDRQFIGINIQYFEKSKIVVRNLALKEIFVRQTAENLKSIILDVLAEFEIDLGNIYSVTTDNGSNYLKVTTLFNEDISNQNLVGDNESDSESDVDVQFDNFDSGVDYFNASILGDSVEDVTVANSFKIPSLRCAAHTLQLCVKDAISKDPRSEFVIDNCRTVVRMLRRPLMKIKIKSQKLRKPVIDCSTRWTSTYNMLLRLKELKAICDDSTEIAESVNDNFWADMNDVLECLRPSAEATLRLQAEQLTLGGFYSVWMICRTKTEKVNLPLAKAIVASMISRESELLTNEAFLAAIFIDPRFKIVLSDEEKEIAKNWLRAVHRQVLLLMDKKNEEIVNQEHEDCSTAAESCSRDSKNMSTSVDKYHDDLKNLELILNETQRVRASGSIGLNFEYYLAEYDTVPRLGIAEDVIKYWSYKLPNKLAEVALIVLAAPATQVTVERLFSTLKFILTPARNRLLDATIKNITLIKCNEDLFDDDN